ncbi:YitT family protein [Gracilibacillus timonensis]|uniref:YitT family protein n=1 Tax=Gracilibacillus timonensis TaxID=1816696 RepID=UPI000825376B|nr:YitT family protein [Gracilibacillus timonensis]
MNKFIKDLVMVIIGCLVYALALTLLAIPNQLAEGGVPGASLILHYAFGWSPGIVTFILTAIVTTIGFRYLPKRSIFLSILTVPLISFFIYSTENLVGNLGDPLISAIFAGVFIGFGTGLIFRTGSAMGGTSLIARMCQDRLGWDLVRTNFVFDIVIVLSGLLVIGPLNTMYTIVALFVAKKVTDIVMEGLDPRKAVSIISGRAPQIADEIIAQMNISVTVFKGYGGYLKQDADMTYVIINKYQLMRLKKIISTVDKDAFVVIHDVRDVLGGSFAWDDTKKGGIK